MTRLLTVLLLSSAMAAPAAALELSPIGTYATGVFDESAAEISAFDPKSKKLFVVNGHDKSIDILDLSSPEQPVKSGTLDISAYGKAANSVAVKGDYVAVAVEADVKQDDGQLLLFKTDGTLVGSAKVGALPDMVAFSADGALAVVANEGEPSGDFKRDPEGSVSIVSIPSLKVRTADFKNVSPKGDVTSIHTPAPKGTRFAQNVEPEYVTISQDGELAFVSLQEANAIAVIDLKAGKVKSVFGLGFKDFSKTPMDASDKDGKAELKLWPVKSLYQPDSIASFEKDGMHYVVSANEGDSRDYEGYSEELRVKDLKLDPKTFPNAAELQDEKALGRLKTTSAMGDVDGDGDHDEIIGYGGRSMSIYAYDPASDTFSQTWDSGSQIAEKLLVLAPSWFNSEGQVSSFDKRSDDKGAEPEGVTLGEVGGKLYAFLGLERMGGVVVYDVSDPKAPQWAGYAHNGKPEGDASAGGAGDIGPEGLLFLSSKDSPNGKPLLVVANEVSGTVTVFEIK